MTFAVSILLFLILLGTPIAISLGVAGLIAGTEFMGRAALAMLPQVMFSSANSFLFLAVPMFILMSELLNRAGITERLFTAANAWLRHLPGGLAISTVVTSAIGATITGSSLANAATMGIVAIPAMLERGYDKRFVYGLVAASGTLGILIPPSIPMILFAAITGESVGDLFAGGVVPGILLTMMLIGYVLRKSKSAAVYAAMPAAKWDERWASTKRAGLGLLVPPIILGGMYSGAFTPTEAGAVGCVYGAIVGFFVYRTLHLRDIFPIALRSVQATAMIMLIAACAMLLGSVVTVMQVPQRLVQGINEIGLSPIMFVIAVNILLLMLGCILEVVSLTFILVPIIYPILLALGINPVWFAIIFVINMELAQITPPVGMVLFVIKGVTEASTEDVIRGAAPFVLVLGAALAIVIAFPQLALWLPEHQR